MRSLLNGRCYNNCNKNRCHSLLSRQLLSVMIFIAINIVVIIMISYIINGDSIVLHHYYYYSHHHLIIIDAIRTTIITINKQPFYWLLPQYIYIFSSQRWKRLLLLLLKQQLSLSLRRPCEKKKHKMSENRKTKINIKRVLGDTLLGYAFCLAFNRFLHSSHWRLLSLMVRVPWDS